MSAAETNLTIEIGAKFEKSYIYADAAQVGIPLAGYIARMHIRKLVGSDTTFHEMTTENGGIILEAGGIAGKITLYIGAGDSSGFTFVSGVYDLELEEVADPDNVVRLLKGKITTDANVTR